MFAIGRDELEKKPRSTGFIECKTCGKTHKIEYSTDKNGNEMRIIGFYNCGNNSYLAELDGKLL